MNFWRKYPAFSRFLLLLLFFLLVLIIVINKTFIPIFFSLAEVEAVRIANRAISQVVDREIEELKYQDLITYKVNNDGDIVLLQPNTGRINRFSSSISLQIQEKLEQITKMEVPIPLLKLLGIDIIAAMGPNLYAKIIPVGFVHPPLVKDSFESAGINQTRHKIYLQVDVEMKLIIPFSQKITRISADLPVTEATILGKVPEVYVNLNGDKMEGIINPEK